MYCVWAFGSSWPRHEFLSHFNLVILYLKGAENEVPDAL